MSASQSYPSVNALTAPLIERFVADAATLRLSVSQTAGGARMVDAGAQARRLHRGRTAHRRDLPRRSRHREHRPDRPDRLLAVFRDRPCGRSGARLPGQPVWRAGALPTRPVIPASSPSARAPAAPWPPSRICFRNSATGIRPRRPLWCWKPPADRPRASSQRFAEAAGLRPEDLTFIFAPTQSLAGSTQVVARVLEVALHKAHTVGFDLHAIVDGIGSAPLSPPHPGLHQGDGQDQRRDHLRRPGAALRRCRRCRRQAACRADPVHHLERPRRSVRRDLLAG